MPATGKLKEFTLTADADFNGVKASAGTVVQSTEEAVTAAYAAAAKNTLRTSIAVAAGDTPSLLGSTTDGTHWLLKEFTSLMDTVSKANSLDDIKAHAADVATRTAKFREALSTGTVKLPYADKGGDAVLDDIAARAHATAQVLGGAAAGGAISPAEEIEAPPASGAQYTSPPVAPPNATPVK